MEASFDITLVATDANGCQATEVFGDAILISESPNALLTHHKLPFVKYLLLLTF